MIWPVTLLATVAAANTLADVEVYLNATNPLFADNNLVEIDVRLGDKIDIFCPRVFAYHDIKSTDEPLYLNLYRVDFRGFKTCSTTLDSKRLIRCNIPEYPKKYTTLIQRVNPLPSGLEFEPNHSYYFIAPTTGRKAGDVEQTEGGVCETDNIRFVLNVIPETTAEPMPTTSTSTSSMSVETTSQIEIIAQPSVALTQDSNQELLETEEKFVMSMEMWLVALLGAFFVILMILIGFCIAYCCLRSNKKKMAYEYSSPQNHAFEQCTTIRRDGEEHLVYSRRLDSVENGTYRVCSTPGYTTDQSFLPFLPGAAQSTLTHHDPLIRPGSTFQYNPVAAQKLVSSQLMSNGYYFAPKEPQMNSTQMETSLSDLNSYNSPASSSNEGGGDDSLPKCNEIKVTSDGHHTVQV